MSHRHDRRTFLAQTSLAGAGLALTGWPSIRAESANAKPAKLGGPKACPNGFPGWPIIDATEEKAILEVLHSKQWYRGSGKAVGRFEEAYRQLTGASHCVATASGTSALTTALGALDIGPGDEVILPPYTFVATYNAITLNYALPIFADIDLESFQMDPRSAEARITPATKALLPVHIGGSPADLDGLLAAAQRHRLPVIEDACQAHLAEWRGRKVGTWGLGGCFSFQASKNLPSGEGGAVLSNDASFAEACVNFHDQGRARRLAGATFASSGTRGSNLRLCEFQGGVLLAQMTRVVEQTNRRTENAAYLTQMLREIPGIHPAKLYEGVTRSAYHLYMFRYDRAHFANLDRAKFMNALGAEGIPASGGYGKMNRGEYVQGLAQNRHFLKIYGEKRMAEWQQQNLLCPQNDQVCEQAVWFMQNLLLGSREDIERVAGAIRKIQRHAAELA